MVRPKVPAHRRQRVSEACNICRETKKRCSGLSPCAQCQRRGLEQQCFMTCAPRGLRAKTAAYAADNPGWTWPQHLPDLLSPPKEPLSEIFQAGSIQETEIFQLASPSLSFPTDTEERPDSTSVAEAQYPMSHTSKLLNLRGERVYIEDAASISFLQVIRGLVAQQIGPSAFSHNEDNNAMMENESPRTENLPNLELDNASLNKEQKRSYLQVCFSVTERLISVFDSQDLEILLSIEQDNETSSNPLRRVAVKLAIAIGAQCSSDSASKSIGQRYFIESRRAASTVFLEDPDVDLIRVFLLMAFYMLGECRRKAAFMYLGIAARAAIALGLHNHESYYDVAPATCQLRLRLWMSVCIVDKLFHSILGRPAATTGIPTIKEALLNDLVKSLDHTANPLLPTYDIVSLINTATSEIYDKKNMSVGLAEKLLEEIELWKHEFMNYLSSDSTTSPKPANLLQIQEGTLGKVHVSCLYYYAVTLVTRPFWIATLSSSSSSSSQNTTYSGLAAACVDASVFLAQTCSESFKAGVMEGNMCILKAILFVCGLILGFESFAKSSPDADVEAGFLNTQEVMRYLSIQSPQAAHYLEILTSLSNAISKLRSRASSTGRGRYVSKIFALTPPQNGEAACKGNLSDSSGNANWTSENFFETASRSLSLLDPIDRDMDWDALKISNWDTFPFGT